MDISDSFDSQQQQQQPQQQQVNEQEMQCDPVFNAPNGLSSINQGIPMPQLTHMPIQMPTQTAIPLPPPPAPASTPAAQEIDIDSMLLQQFSCLGTTDHEDLISQFQTIMNDQVNKDSAQFFLEMNNWNLQAAVGCYMDNCNLSSVPSMKIIEESRPNEFQQAWKLQNDGTENWPQGCYLSSPSQERRVSFHFTIKPGDTINIIADIPPSQPAVMWRLCTPNGWYFGETIWMIPPGTCGSQEDLVQRITQLTTSPSVLSTQSCPQVNVTYSVDFN